MLKRLFFNVGSKAAVIVSQFLALVLTNHIIGPEGRGIFLAAITWSNTFFILSHCSISTGILNLCNKRVQNIYSVTHLGAIAAAALGTLSFFIAFAAFGLLPQVFNNLNAKYIILAFTTIPFMMVQQYGMAAVQVKGNFRAFNLLYAAYSVLNLLGIAIAWLLQKTTLEVLLYINLLAWIITGIIALYFMWPFIKNRVSIPSISSLLIKTSLAAHFGAIVSFVVSRSDILIVNYFSIEKQTGIYGLAVGIVQMLLIIPLSVQNVLYHALLGKPVTVQKTILLQYSRITVAVMIVCAIVVLLLSKPLVYILGGKSFEEAIPLFKYFLPGIIFYSVPVVLATQWNIMGIFKQVNAVSIIVLLTSVVSNFLLVPYLGIIGGGITFLIIAFMSFLIHVYLVKKNLGDTSVSDIILLKSSDLKFFLGRNNI